MAPPHVIIVGGGSAGCVLARRLTDPDAPSLRVTLLETGDENRTSTRPSHMRSPMPGDVIADKDWAFPQLLSRRATTQAAALYASARVARCLAHALTAFNMGDTALIGGMLQILARTGAWGQLHDQWDAGDSWYSRRF
jgi:choline dehydrogenase-like flavoprotein